MITSQLIIQRVTIVTQAYEKVISNSIVLTVIFTTGRGNEIGLNFISDSIMI